MANSRTRSLWATFAVLCDGSVSKFDDLFEEDAAINLLQLRANKTAPAEHETGRKWWRDQGCKADLGDDVAKCRFKSDVHNPENWGGANGDCHQHGFQVAAQTNDDSVTAHIFQCPWERSPSTSQVSGLAMQMGEHLIECHRPSDCHSYISCTVDGEDISFSSFPRTWDSGLYMERGAHYMLCIDSPDRRASAQIQFRFEHAPNCEKMKGRAWFELDLKLQRDLVRTDDGSLCGRVPGPNNGQIPSLTCEESLFSNKGCTRLCEGCDWGGAQPGNCNNLPGPEPVPPSQQLCEESGCSFEHAQQACGSLSGHSEAYEGCLLDVCSQCESEEELDAIAQDDVEDEEDSNPGPACVDEADCGLPSDTCADSVKLNTLTVSQNNFGGAGPDTGPEEIRYSNAAAVGGRVIDLVVKQVGGSYTGNSAKNGKKGSFGVVNLRHKKSVEVEFSFVDSTSGEPVTLDAVALSFFDLDEGKKGKSRTTITACDARNAILTTNTELAVARPNNCYAVSSTEHGNAANNPSSLTHLTPSQAGRSVTFDYATVSSIRVTLAISKGWGKRNTLWSFDPAVACLSGNDPAMPLNPAAPVDPNEPSEETCPEFTRGDGKGPDGSDRECSAGGQSTLSGCMDACKENCGHVEYSGVAVGAGIAAINGKPNDNQNCYCEKETVTTNGNDKLLNIFCPPWKPNCNLDNWRACKAALVARGGLSGVTIAEN